MLHSSTLLQFSKMKKQKKITLQLNAAPLCTSTREQQLH